MVAALSQSFCDPGSLKNRDVPHLTSEMKMEKRFTAEDAENAEFKTEKSKGEEELTALCEGNRLDSCDMNEAEPRTAW
jgi:hypothetical protein